MDSSVLDQILEKVSHLEGTQAYAAIFGVLFACGMGVPIPEDITLFVAGYLTYLGNIELGPAIMVCLVGVLIGDYFLFFLGRIYGKKVLQWKLLSFVLTPERVALAQQRLKKNAKKVCFVARFLAGLRAPIFFTAGMLGVRPVVFMTLDGLAALISVPFLTYIGFYFGNEIEIGLNYMRKAERYILIGLALIGLVVILKNLFKKINAPT
ncbi:MAG: DedA family protein [Oligoflexia bacterium]|nr:DedA family protein [Oligoflexia bacterium]